MARELKGSRSSREASVVLSSVTVEARRLDATGAPVGDAITLAGLTIDKDTGTVALDRDDGGWDSPADGWQILLRERGRDSQTTAVKVFFAPEVVEPTPDPEPEPTPEPEPEPEPTPTPSGWPDATNTGYRGTTPLTKRSGYTVRTAGALIQHEEISGTLIIDAPNVVVRNCVVRASFFGIETTRNGRGLIVEDCTVIGGGDCGIAVTQADSPTVSRCNISGGYDGMKVGGANVLLERNYIHDLYSDAGAHNDGIQCMGGVTNLRVIGNRIEARDTSCLAMFEGQGTWNGATIDGNWMGGAGYLIYAGGSSGTDIKIRGNTFGSYGYNHPVTDWAPKTGHEFSGNVYTDGRPVPQP